MREESAMSKVEERLQRLGYRLPELLDPMAEYLPAKRVGNLVFVSGQGPYVDGRPQFAGRVGDRVTLEEARLAARSAVLNGLAAAATVIASLDDISQVVHVRGFVNSAPGFVQQPSVVDGASQLLVEVFGECGRHARASIGICGLPSDLPVEIELVFEVRG